MASKCILSMDFQSPKILNNCEEKRPFFYVCNETDPLSSAGDDDVSVYGRRQVEDKGRMLMEIDELQTLVHIH